MKKFIFILSLVLTMALGTTVFASKGTFGTFQGITIPIPDQFVDLGNTMILVASSNNNEIRNHLRIVTWSDSNIGIAYDSTGGFKWINKTTKLNVSNTFNYYNFNHDSAITTQVFQTYLDIWDTSYILDTTGTSFSSILTNPIVLYGNTPLYNYENPNQYVWSPIPPMADIDPLQHYVVTQASYPFVDYINELSANRVFPYKFRLPTITGQTDTSKLKISIGSGLKQPLTQVATDITYDQTEDGVLIGYFDLTLSPIVKGQNNFTITLYDELERPVQTNTIFEELYTPVGTVPDIEDSDNDGTMDLISSDAPKRTEYPDNILGSVEFATDTFLYYLTYPFKAIAKSVRELITALGDNFAWIKDFSSFAKDILSVLPTPVQGLISVVLISTIIIALLKVIKR